ncbi:protein lifeguard 4 isoform X2 [Ailuropoda melanoleuca]|uniref:protein lifeguard 4 isoform X2 n=1 Tax=Ailuropoda melanoleuca TaxID=9646 RepID=UPI000947BE34|nr:protein lifeguard 4 isoform X2 [Ailuropoda melanoleuca]
MSASCARLVGAGALHPGSGSKAVESESFPWGRWGAAADMADPDPRYPCSSIEDDFNYGSCVASASVHIRMAFLRKVYSILSLQVLLTTVTASFFLYFESIRTFVHESPALILVFALGSLGLILALTVNRHKHPLNLYLLFGFTLFEALTVAFVVTFYDVYIILQAFILTTAVFLGLTGYTLQSKRDFTKFGAGLFAVLWILCLSGILKSNSGAGLGCCGSPSLLWIHHL